MRFVKSAVNYDKLGREYNNMPYSLLLKKRQNFKLSSAAKYVVGTYRVNRLVRLLAFV